MREVCFTLDVDISKKSGPYGLPEHYRPRQYAAVWHERPPRWRESLALAIQRGVGNHSSAVFFRADDIGAGGKAFEVLCQIFRNHQVPLAMAVVPAWLSAARREQLFRAAPVEEPYWGWHQHGWRHVNWQRTGKKSEFGEERPFEKQWRDIMQGRQKMQYIFGDHFIQVFTPPWNRLSNATIRILQQLDFKGVSLAGPFPRGTKLPIALANLRVQMDLHTRKARNGPEDFQHLLVELETLVGRKEPFGIMIHHHRMTPFAFEFLDHLLYLLKTEARSRFLSFTEILENEDTH